MGVLKGNWVAQRANGGLKECEGCSWVLKGKWSCFGGPEGT